MRRKTNAQHVSRLMLPAMAVLIAIGTTAALLAVDRGPKKPRGHRVRDRSTPNVVVPPFDDPSSALHFLPPLGDEPNVDDPAGLDTTLIDAITVSICEVDDGSCTTVEEFTSSTGNPGHGQVKLQSGHYHLNWRLHRPDVGKAFEIHVVVMGLDLGSATYTPNAPRTLPIKFQIANHPVIRAYAMHQQGYTATQVAEVLRDEFGLEALQTAQILLDVGYALADTAAALRDVFSLGAVEVAQMLSDLGYASLEVCQALKDAGFSGAEVGLALRDVFGLDAMESAQMLKNVGFDAVEVGMCLRDVFSKGAEDTAQILKDIGFSAVEVAEALKDPSVFNLEAEPAAHILKDIGFSAVEIAEALKDPNVFNLGAKPAAQILKDIGFSAVEIAEALKAPNVFNLGAGPAAQILKDIGFDAVEIGEALKDPNVFDLEAEPAAQILKDIGFSAFEIAEALKDPNVFNLDAKPAAQILKDIGFDAVEITTCLIDVFGVVDAGLAAQILKDVGFSAADVGFALRDVFLLGRDAVVLTLRQLGFSDRQVGGALLEVYNTIAAITDLVVADDVLEWFQLRTDGYTPVPLASCTEPFIPNILGQAGNSPCTFPYYDDDVFPPRNAVKSIWVKYELVGKESNEQIMADVGIFDLYGWSCDRHLADSTRAGQLRYISGTTDWYSVCVVYKRMHDIQTPVSNLCFAEGERRTPFCTAYCSQVGEDLAVNARWEGEGYKDQTSLASANGGLWHTVKGGDTMRTATLAESLWYAKTRKHSPTIPPSVDSITDAEKLELLTEYAPVVEMSYDEHHFASSVEWFFERTKREQPNSERPYLWAELRSCSDYHGVNDPDLGDGEFPFANDAFRNAPAYAFWLEKPITLADGEQVEVVDLIYYTFWPWNQGFTGHSVSNRGCHVGDWEHVSVRLLWHHEGQGEWSLRPVQIYLPAHDFGSLYEWSSFRKYQGTGHPWVAVARDSHGYWPGHGEWVYREVAFGLDIPDDVRGGPFWGLWSNLKPYVFDPDPEAVANRDDRDTDCTLALANPAGYSLQDGTWPLWLADCTGDLSYGTEDPASGPIHRWGNKECENSPGVECDDCACGAFHCRLVSGPIGPADRLWRLRANERLK